MGFLVDGLGLWDLGGRPWRTGHCGFSLDLWLRRVRGPCARQRGVAMRSPRAGEDAVRPRGPDGLSGRLGLLPWKPSRPVSLPIQPLTRRGPQDSSCRLWVRSPHHAGYAAQRFRGRHGGPRRGHPPRQRSDAWWPPSGLRLWRLTSVCASLPCLPFSCSVLSRVL